MTTLLDTAASTSALAAAGIFFLAGLLTGAWKYFCMLASENTEAPYYVNIAHRAALLYAFAALLVAIFARYSAWPAVVDIVATIAPLFFFGFAIVHYIRLGPANETDNYLRDSPNPAGDRVLMWALMSAEIGGFSILLIGFFISIIQGGIPT